MVTKILKLNEIKAADYNPRRNLKPEDDEYQKLKRSIETFGFVEPLIVNERTMTIVGGHQRYKILRDLGIDETEAVIVNLTPSDEKILNVALNKIESGWDVAKLQTLFSELKAELQGADLTVTGFCIEEISNLCGDLSEVVAEPSPPPKPIEQKPAAAKIQADADIFKIYLSFKNCDTALDWLDERGFGGSFNRGRTITVDMHDWEAKANATG